MVTVVSVELKVNRVNRKAFPCAHTRVVRFENLPLHRCTLARADTEDADAAVWKHHAYLDVGVDRCVTEAARDSMHYALPVRA